MVYVETFPLIDMRIFGPVNMPFLICDLCLLCCSQIDHLSEELCVGVAGSGAVIVETEVFIVQNGARRQIPGVHGCRGWP